MKVSIVTISLNQARFLEHAIQSVINQDHDDLEYIVVDAGSTDGSREIIKRYKNKIAGVIFEHDDGPSSGLNKGLFRATGDIFGYLNADDMLMPGTVREVARTFRRLPNADVIYGHGFLVDEDGRPLRRLRSAPFNLKRSTFGAATVVQQSTFFRRAPLLSVGGFRKSNRSCWDYELLVDLAVAKRHFQRVDAYWALYRKHGQSITSTPSFDALFRNDLDRIFERIVGRPPCKSDMALRLVARIHKWALDPRSFFIRLGEILGVLPNIESRHSHFTKTLADSLPRIY